MFDYLIAIAVGVVGVFVVYTLFLSISVTETPVARPATTKKANKKKSVTAEQSKKAKKEEDAIIAAELAIANTGMQADKKVFHADTLDETKDKQRKQSNKGAAKETTTQVVQQTQSAKQVAADKDAGFEVVKAKSAAQVEQQAKKAKSPSPTNGTITQKEALDKKLGSFFRNNAKKGKKRYDDDNAPEGPKINYKKNFGAKDGEGKAKTNGNYWKKADE